MASGTRISLIGMRFNACVGLLPHERDAPQPLELDLSVWIENGDGFVATAKPGFVDYRALYALAEEVVGAHHHDLLETLCETLAGRALAMDGVSRVLVAARKPRIEFRGPVDSVEVAVDRPRDADR